MPLGASETDNTGTKGESFLALRISYSVVLTLLSEFPLLRFPTAVPVLGSAQPCRHVSVWHKELLCTKEVVFKVCWVVFVRWSDLISSLNWSPLNHLIRGRVNKPATRFHVWWSRRSSDFQLFINFRTFFGSASQPSASPDEAMRSSCSLARTRILLLNNRPLSGDLISCGLLSFICLSGIA